MVFYLSDTYIFTLFDNEWQQQLIKKKSRTKMLPLWMLLQRSVKSKKKNKKILPTCSTIISVLA